MRVRPTHPAAFPGRRRHPLLRCRTAAPSQAAVMRTTLRPPRPLARRGGAASGRIAANPINTRGMRSENRGGEIPGGERSGAAGTNAATSLSPHPREATGATTAPSMIASPDHMHPRCCWPPPRRHCWARWTRRLHSYRRVRWWRTTSCDIPFLIWTSLPRRHTRRHNQPSPRHRCSTHSRALTARRRRRPRYCHLPCRALRPHFYRS